MSPPSPNRSAQPRRFPPTRQHARLLQQEGRNAASYLADTMMVSYLSLTHKGVLAGSIPVCMYHDAYPCRLGWVGVLSVRKVYPGMCNRQPLGQTLIARDRIFFFFATVFFRSVRHVFGSLGIGQGFQVWPMCLAVAMRRPRHADRSVYRQVKWHPP